MPSWRKVILSGSDAALNTLSVSSSITASVVSASQFTGSLFGTSSWAISASRAVSSSYALTASFALNGGGGGILGNQYETVYFENTNDPAGATYVNTYPLHVEGWGFKVGRNSPTPTIPSGAHVLKDNRELFTNAKVAVQGEPFILLGFGQKNDVSLTATDNFEHPGIDEYDGGLIPGNVYGGSLKLRKTLYGIQDADGNTKLVADGGFVVKPSSPGFLVGQGGYYIFESASMQFNASGALISPVTSASVRLGLATDSSSFTIAVGKNNLTNVLYISRSGDDARIAIGGNYRTPRNTLDISGSLRVFTSITASTVSASGVISSSNLSITGFPNVSASLASLSTGVGTLQQVTDAGNTTTNPISSSFAGVGFFGTASWAINVVNGGGGGSGGADSAFLTQSTAAVTWSFAHNLGTQYPVITVYDTTGLVIIPQEIDGEDTNNLKIYFPTSQSGYATAVGGTSALTYYSQSLTTASVNLNTITFTKGDSSTFNITVNTGSSTITSSFALTASYVNSLRQDVIITGSTYITGGFEALGNKGSKIQLGTYNVGYDLVGVDTLYITGAGLIISGNMPDQNHHNFLKIGNVEIVDVNTAATTNEFLIHNVNTLRITSGADGGNITTNNQLLKIGGGQFYIYRAGSGDSSGIIQSTNNTTKISDTLLDLFGQSGSYFYIPSTNEITTLNGTDYLMGFASDPSFPGTSLTNKIKADKFIWVTGSNQIISGGLIITGSTNSSGGFTGSLFGTASWAQSASNAINSQTASFLPIGTYNITASWAQSASNAVNARTASFINDLNQNLSITGAVVLSGSSLPELRVIGETQFTGSVSSLNGFTGSLFGTASWATNALTASYVLNAISSSFSSTASFTPNAIITASVNLNTITFTKGSGATFNITVDTGSGGGGGGGVTINNNIDNYIITATGTANTLNGEANLQYSSSILINRGRSLFTYSGLGVANTTHYFRATGSDTNAGFLMADKDGEDLFKVAGSIADSDSLITIGDVGNAANATKIEVNDATNYINLQGITRANQVATEATALTAAGEFDIGSRIARDWSSTGPALIAGRIVYLSGSTQWAQAQANASGSSYGMLGVVINTESQREILIEGTIRISGSALSSGIVGQPVYLSAATAGQVSLTAPTGSGQISRVIGYVYRTSGNVMYFRPDNTYTVGI